MSDSEFENGSVSSKTYAPLHRHLGVKKAVEGALESGLGELEETVPVAKAVRERRKPGVGLWSGC